MSKVEGREIATFYLDDYFANEQTEKIRMISRFWRGERDRSQKKIGSFDLTIKEPNPINEMLKV